MSKKQLQALEPGQRLEWVEPDSPADHGQRGQLKTDMEGRKSILWADGERVPVREDTWGRLAPHLKKVRD